MFGDPTFWVLVAFIGFIILLIYFKVPGMVTNALDARANKIKADLDEADSILKEAQSLLALYQKKQREANDEAQRIITHARAEAETIMENGLLSLEDQLKRREKMAADRIKQAESSAIDQVRSRTVDIAMEATHGLLSKKLPEARAELLLKTAITDLPKKLN